MKNCHINSLILTALITLLSAGVTKGQNKRWNTYKANNEIKKGNFHKATYFFNRALKKDSTYYKANIGLAKNYLYNHQIYDSASVYLKRALKHYKKDTNYIDCFDYANCLRLSNKPAEAIDWYNKFKLLFIEEKNINISILDSTIEQNIEYARRAEKAMKKTENKVEISNMDFYINSKEGEYTPIYISKNNTLIFNARYKDYKNEHQFSDYQYMENIYFFDLTNLISSTYDEFQSKNTHSAVVSKNEGSDSIVVYFQNKLWITTLNQGRMKERTPLPAILSNYYFQPHGIFSTDQKTFYFSAKTKPEDNLNIYISHKSEDKWSKPYKIPGPINTEYDEDSPFLSKDGKTLYFSSKGHNSSGGYDIFKTTKVDGIWTQPIALAYPYNSPADDIYFTIDEKEETGYLSSNRQGGFGLMDIYSITEKPKPNFDCIASIDVNNEIFINHDKIEYSLGGKAILSPVLNEESTLYVTDYYWMINDSIIKKNIESLQLDIKENIDYDIKLQVFGFYENRRVSYCYSDKIIVKTKTETIEPKDTNVAVDNNQNDNQLNLLTEIEPIYFGFDKSNINENARLKLDKLIDLMNKNSEIKIVLSGHTDDHGDSKYNLSLSNKRINSTLSYLTAKGIDRDRIIKTLNKGESSPVVPNILKDGKDNITGRKLNRRVEFKIEK